MTRQDRCRASTLPLAWRTLLSGSGCLLPLSVAEGLLGGGRDLFQASSKCSVALDVSWTGPHIGRSRGQGNTYPPPPIGNAGSVYAHTQSHHHSSATAAGGTISGARRDQNFDWNCKQSFVKIRLVNRVSKVLAIHSISRFPHTTYKTLCFPNLTEMGKLLDENGTSTLFSSMCKKMCGVEDQYLSFTSFFTRRRAWIILGAASWPCRNYNHDQGRYL